VAAGSVGEIGYAYTSTGPCSVW